MTGVDNWGNGDVESGLMSLDDLLCVTGLVRELKDREVGGSEWADALTGMRQDCTAAGGKGSLSDKS